MSQNVFALLVAINDYSPEVGPLRGPLNDLEHYQAYLSESFDKEQLHLEVLKNSDATRPNIINLFRSHLCRAAENDVVLFQYCGHGARCASAEQFRKYFPDGKDEGLVCYDSRQPGGYDLADKELAVLLSEVARNNPHIAVILDSCHSGSATRSVDDFTQLKSRTTHEVFEERPLESYLDGYYSELHDRGEELVIPHSRHILLAAAQRIQYAWEGRDFRGVFSKALLEVLDQSGGDISYADLFMRCRAAVHKRVVDQDPQFETYSGFNAYGGFLGSRTSQAPRRYSVSFDVDCWKVNCGAIQGLPTEPEKTTEFALYQEADPDTCFGRAVVTRVGAQKSDLELIGFEAHSRTHFLAEIRSLPVAPLLVLVEGDPDRAAALHDLFAASTYSAQGVSLIADPEVHTRYRIVVEDGSYLLTFRATGKLIQGAAGETEAAADYLFSVLKRIADWERAVQLQNHRTKMNPADVPFRFLDLDADDDAGRDAAGEITFDVRDEDGSWTAIHGMLKAKNLTSQPLHLTMIHFSEDYGIQQLYNDRIEPTESEFVITLGGYDDFRLGLDDDEGDEAVHTFKLIVSTEKVDDFLLSQEPLEIGRTMTFGGDDNGGTRGLTLGARPKLVHENEWLTKDLRIRLVRRLGRISDSDTSLAGGQITIKGHPTFAANVSLNAAARVTRHSASHPDFYLALERQGLELLSFRGTAGDNLSVLELTDISDPGVLADQPLEIHLAADLGEDECVLPLAFDGQHILRPGESARDESGHARIRIDRVPDIPDTRRSSGAALKLYFFKTCLTPAEVDALIRSADSDETA